MEFLGAVASGITLVALFKHTFDVLDLIHLYQTQDEDFNNLQLEFKLEKCRLYNWGVALKLTDAANKTPLRGWHSEMIVIECLERIIRLFNDAGKLREKYGCSEISPTELRRIEQQPMYNKTTGNIAAAFDNFKIRASRSVKQPPLPLRKTKWIIRDRKKYLILVQEIRTLIDSLEKITEELTSVVKLESMLQARVNLIPNIDTLLMIANVWKESHPRVSSAASTQAEGLSMSSGKVQDISDWQTLVGSEDAADISTANLEEMTITELKHLVLRSNQELDQLRNSLSGDIQRLADRSRTESNGLKVITAFTLIFLPVTFIATFSSLDYDTSKTFLWPLVLATTCIMFITVYTCLSVSRRKGKLQTGIAFESDNGTKILTIVVMLFMPTSFVAAFFHGQSLTFGYDLQRDAYKPIVGLNYRGLTLFLGITLVAILVGFIQKRGRQKPNYFNDDQKSNMASAKNLTSWDASYKLV